MLVSGAMTSQPSSARPSASRRAFAWSSASRSTLWSSAYRQPAATMPAWRNDAAHLLLPAPGLGDQLARAAQHGADGRAEALREVEPGRVEAAGVLGGGHAGGDDRVHQPRAVQVGAQAVLARGLEHLVHALERPDAPAAHVGRLLDRDQARARHVAAVGADRRANLVAAEDAAVAVERVDHQPRVPGGPAGLGNDRVRGAVEDQLVAAGPGVQAQGDLVAHRPAGQEHGRLVAEQLGHALLEPAGGGVLAALLVADVGAGDRTAHPVAGRVWVSL